MTEQCTEVNSFRLWFAFLRWVMIWLIFFCALCPWYIIFLELSFNISFSFWKFSVPYHWILNTHGYKYGILFKSSNIWVWTSCFSSVQFSSVAQSCPTPCEPMNCSTPGLPLRHQLLKFTQTHIHLVSDAILQSLPLLSPSPPIFNLSQHQGLVFSFKIRWRLIT